MSRRRQISTRKKQHQFGGLIERLEERCLLTTIDNFGLVSSRPTTIEFKDARNQVIRVSYQNVTAELIFVRIPKATGPNPKTGRFDEANTPVVSDLINPLAGGKANPADGHDLFAIYVSQASMDSYISIASVAAPPSDNPRPMQPFGGSVSLNVPNLQNGEITAISTSGGSVWIGALTIQPTGTTDAKVANHPILSTAFSGLGVAPAPARNRLVAGVITAPGVSLGRMMIGGAVSGQVSLGGSMDTFYCGNLLTGDTTGREQSFPANFFVAGEIRNVLVNGDIGGNGLPSGDDRPNPVYETGFDMKVMGKIGQVKVKGDYLGHIDAVNDPTIKGTTARQRESELRIWTGDNRGGYTDFENGQFGDRQSFFFNDTFDTPQYLGAINSKIGQNTVQLNGTLFWVAKRVDEFDYYAVSLMAGQHVSVRLLDPEFFLGTYNTTTGVFTPEPSTAQLPNPAFTSPVRLFVYDPDRRLIASDYNNDNPVNNQSTVVNGTNHSSQVSAVTVTAEQTLEFTADRPGVYRFAVGKSIPLTGNATRADIIQSYQLQIKGLGNLAMGGLTATDMLNPLTTGTVIGGIFNTVLPDSVTTDLGDIGAIHADGFIDGDAGNIAHTVLGDCRDIDALSMGQFFTANNLFGDGPNFAINGNVGLLRTTGADPINNYMVLNQLLDPSAMQPIGGNLQMLDSASSTAVNIVADGNIGTFKADNLSVNFFHSTLAANADGKGNDGNIDLIDIAKDTGSIKEGGMDISTGGGNVHYMRVGGTAFRPRAFGGGLPEETQFSAGQAVSLTDDSGSNVTLTPTDNPLIDPITGLPAIDPATGLTITNPGALTVLTYPIGRSLTDKGGGGVVILNVASTTGVTVDAGSSTKSAPVEIGRIQANGIGAPLIPDPGQDQIPKTSDDPLGPDGIANTGDEPLVLDPNSTSNLTVDLRGPAKIDVFDIEGNNFNLIRNRTGEIANLKATSIGDLFGTTLGLMKSSISGLALLPINDVDGAGIGSGSAAGTDTLAGGSGGTEGNTFPFAHQKNAIIVTGDVALARSTLGLGNFLIGGTLSRLRPNSDGKGTKAVFEGIDAPILVGKRMLDINIGEGILPSGTGDLSQAGLYCLGRIDQVGNQSGSDIRGDIVSADSIGSIGLANGGSIINADIMVVNDVPKESGGARLKTSEEFIPDAYPIPNGFGTEFGSIDRIVLTGNGGIIGSLFVGNNIGPVTIQGFGMIQSTMLTLGAGRFGTITAAGLGVRRVFFQGGQSIDGVNATGTGKRVATTSYSPSVRFSETGAVDPYFGTPPNLLTDLHVNMGTSAKTPARKGVSNTGAIVDIKMAFSRDAGPLTAQYIRRASMSFGNQINQITARDYIDNIQITTGKLIGISTGGEMAHSSIVVAGPIGSINVGSTLRGSTGIAASGINGTIGPVVVGGSLYGVIQAQGNISSVRVGGVLGSPFVHTGGNLATLSVNGSLVDGAFIEVKKRLGTLSVGGDIDNGAKVKARSIGNRRIAGVVLGDIVVG